MAAELYCSFAITLALPFHINQGFGKKPQLFICITKGALDGRFFACSIDRPTLPARILIVIRGGTGWSNRRDLDNTIKATVDAIVQARLLPDDTTRYVHGVRCEYLPAQPGLAAGCIVSFCGGPSC